MVDLSNEGNKKLNFHFFNAHKNISGKVKYISFRNFAKGNSRVKVGDRRSNFPKSYY